jgi:hypothetical protein
MEISEQLLDIGLVNAKTNPKNSRHFFRLANPEI